MQTSGPVFLLSCIVNSSLINSLKYWSLPPQCLRLLPLMLCFPVSHWESVPRQETGASEGSPCGFLPLNVTGLCCLLPNVWKIVALYILFYFIVFEDGRVCLIPITPLWPKLGVQEYSLKVDRYLKIAIASNRSTEIRKESNSALKFKFYLNFLFNLIYMIKISDRGLSQNNAVV